MTQVLISGLGINEYNVFQDNKVSLGLDASGVDKITGMCTACGKWAGSITARLEQHHVSCSVDFYREWRRKMWEQSVYDTLLNVVGVIRDQQPTTVADVARYYEDEVSEIIWEFSQLLRGWKAITLLYGFEERILGLAESRGVDIPCTINEVMFPYIWGNPVYLQSKAYGEYLHYAQKEKKLILDVKLPDKSDADDSYISKMRQGNLRADGVV
jgi:hypothetical protein